ncbi:phosphate/phosphite/phosphonate ABC transporter substrate-binding protein [Clostridium tetani]|uniref:phosphate/phosphite/phosphonate ABC transporter substrate-binding protein n=1 Tax=Clostridium tetani TaxID=1513 RepID=UPI001FB0C157|nr:PhnD/SsuA/transferrin family substrate-binding protein [Clostridium tetani]
MLNLIIYFLVNNKSLIILSVIFIIFINYGNKKSDIVKENNKKDKENYGKIFESWQTLSFDIHQLLWMYKDSMKTLTKTINKERLDPDNPFKEVQFKDGHHSVIESVLSGEADGGATYSEAIESVKNEGVPIEDIVIIKEFSNIPKDVIASRPDMDKNLIQKLKKAFLEFNCLEKIKSPVEGFIEPEDIKYNVIREIV